MADIPDGWEVVTPTKPAGVPDGWEVLGKAKTPSDEFGDTAAIGAGGLAKGAREGVNPLHLLSGLAFLGKHASPAVPPEVSAVQDDLIGKLTKGAGVIDTAMRGTPMAQDVSRGLKETTGYTADDLSSPDAAYKATGAERTPTRNILAKVMEVIGGSIPAAPFMAAAPIRSAIGTLASGLGSGVGEEVAGPIGGLAGMLVPGVGLKAAESATRGLLRGSSGENLTQTLRDFERAGTTPSIGQATGSNTLSAAESTVGRFGAVGQMKKFGETQAAQMGERAEEIANKFSPPMDKEAIGRYVRTGITGKGGFIEKTEQKANQLYADVDKAIPKETPIMLPNTIAYLEQSLANPRKSGIVAAATDEATKRLSPYLEGITNDLRVGKGFVPFEDVRLALTRVGKKIDQSILTGDVTVKEAKQLYAAMSEDIRQSLGEVPGALRAWQKASGYYGARMTRLEDTLDPLIESKTPERIITALDTSKREGSTTIRTVYKSIDPETRNMLTAANIRELGKATPGAQNAEGAIFSPAQFVSRWNRIDDSAKMIMFDGNGQRDLRFALDSFARAADKIKQGSTVLQNKSGTAAAVYNLAAWIGGPTGGGVLGGAVGALAGVPGAASAAAGVAGSALAMNRLGHLMTNPQTVRWLARSTSVDAATWARQGLNIARELGDDDMKAAINEIINPSSRK